MKNEFNHQNISNGHSARGVRLGLGIDNSRLSFANRPLDSRPNKKVNTDKIFIGFCAIAALIGTGLILASLLVSGKKPVVIEPPKVEPPKPAPIPVPVSVPIPVVPTT
jgi:hypothetical protein